MCLRIGARVFLTPKLEVQNVYVAEVPVYLMKKKQKKNNFFYYLLFLFIIIIYTSQQNRDFDRDWEKPLMGDRQNKQNNVILSSINISPFSNMIGTQK